MSYSGGTGGSGGGRGQAERLLEVAGKLLSARDLVGCKRFAERAVEADPLLPGADELLAVADVFLASQTTLPSGHADPAAILQLPPNADLSDNGAISRAYRRLALLLGNRNPHPGADAALRLVHDAFSFLSGSSRVPPPSAQAGAAAAPAPAAEAPDFWTACPFCCYVHQYPRDLVGRALKCPNEACRQGFVAAEMPTAPTAVPGTDMYHCAWGFFPLGFPSAGDQGSNWKPFCKMFPWNNAPSGGGANARSYGSRGGGSARQNGSARGRGVSSRGRVKKTTARKRVGAGRRSFGGSGVESGIEQDGWAEDEEARGININEEAHAPDGTSRANAPRGVEDMGSFHLDVDPNEDILGNLGNMPFLRVDNLGRMM